MEDKPGVQLDTVWDDLSETSKLSIADQLRDIFTQVRAIPSPGLFGSVAGGPLRHKCFLSVQPQPDVNGPFRTEKDFSMAMALRSQRNRSRQHMPDQRAWLSKFFMRYFPEALAGHASVLTHGDVQRKNILVERVPKMASEAEEGENQGEDEKGEEGDEWQVSAVVDWEEAGWYPSYWEYVGVFIHFSWVDDWPEKFERIVEPCPLEGACCGF